MLLVVANGVEENVEEKFTIGWPGSVFGVELNAEKLMAFNEISKTLILHKYKQPNGMNIQCLRGSKNREKSTIIFFIPSSRVLLVLLRACLT